MKIWEKPQGESYKAGYCRDCSTGRSSKGGEHKQQENTPAPNSQNLPVSSGEHRDMSYPDSWFTMMMFATAVNSMVLVAGALLLTAYLPWRSTCRGCAKTRGGGGGRHAAEYRLAATVEPRDGVQEAVAAVEIESPCHKMYG